MYNDIGLVSKGSEDIASESTDNNVVVDNPTVV